MSVFDLRQWLADADRAGELEHVRGADLLRRAAQRWPELAR